MTATGDAGDTLELGDDCLLTFNPATEALKTSSLVATTETGSLQRRAAFENCLYTSTSVVTSTVNTITTTSATITRAAASEGFSCPPMSVTNSIGDELSLDEQCQMVFKPAETEGPAASSQGESASSTGDVTDLLVSKFLVSVVLSMLIGIGFL